MPALALLAARVLDLNLSAAIAIILLGAAPFAPAVPIFARFAGGIFLWRQL